MNVDVTAASEMKVRVTPADPGTVGGYVVGMERLRESFPGVSLDQVLNLEMDVTTVSTSRVALNFSTGEVTTSLGASVVLRGSAAEGVAGEDADGVPMALARIYSLRVEVTSNDTGTHRFYLQRTAVDGDEWTTGPMSVAEEKVMFSELAQLQPGGKTVWQVEDETGWAVGSSDGEYGFVFQAGVDGIYTVKVTAVGTM